MYYIQKYGLTIVNILQTEERTYHRECPYKVVRIYKSEFSAYGSRDVPAWMFYKVRTCHRKCSTYRSGDVSAWIYTFRRRDLSTWMCYIQKYGYIRVIILNREVRTYQSERSTYQTQTYHHKEVRIYKRECSTCRSRRSPSWIFYIQKYGPTSENILQVEELTYYRKCSTDKGTNIALWMNYIRKLRLPRANLLNTEVRTYQRKCSI